jgi:hypothetical protein
MPARIETRTANTITVAHSHQPTNCHNDSSGKLRLQNQQQDDTAIMEVNTAIMIMKLEGKHFQLTIHAKFYADNRRVAYYTIATRAK